MQQLQVENNNFRRTFERLQSTPTPDVVPIELPNPISLAKEPHISLPNKFDETRAKFRDFVNQVQLMLDMQPQRYPTVES